ncbi:unnamed protein product [Durusdinium trenchii]|uniref:RRM domain-containing protein n=2 Tax=Durusdinium trenchii TaxID=1381693 RepID=A0ABP0S6G1_9DINO
MTGSPSRLSDDEKDDAKPTQASPEARGRGRKKFQRTIAEDSEKKNAAEDKPKKKRRKKRKRRKCLAEASRSKSGPDRSKESRSKSGEMDDKGSEGTKASSAEAAKDGSHKEGKKHRRRRRRKRKSRSSSSHSSRRRRRSSGGSRGSRSSGRSAMDHRPLVERVKGGVKLFVGRLPVETTSDLLSRAFEEYGEVLEVFLIDGRGASGARCAFVRLSHLKDAERAIEDMHEKRVLVHERAELGPIQVAFAKGEAIRMGLDASKEQLPARWQVPITAGAPIPASGPVEPDSLSKEALISLVKEGQRSGGQPFKQQWWSYCDQGRGGVADYDPKRHSEKSLRQFFAACQAGEWGAKPWFRRAVNWATMGGKRSRGRQRRRGSSSSSSRSSRSSRSSSRPRKMEGHPEAGQGQTAGKAAERIKRAEAAAEASREKEGISLGLDLPSVDGLLGSALVDLEAAEVHESLAEEERQERGTHSAAHEAEPQPAEDHEAIKEGPKGEPEQMPEGEPNADTTPSMLRQKLSAPQGCQVFVKNLDKTTGERELRDLFGRHGTICDVEIATEEGTRVGKGFAIVAMSSKREAKQCVKALNFTKPWGRALIVEREDGIEDSPSRSASGEDKGSQADKVVKPPEKSPGQDVKRHSSRSKSRSRSESGWSRYTIEGKGRRSRGRWRSSRRKHERRSKTKRRSRAKSSRSRSSKGRSDSRSSSGSRSHSRSKRRKDRTRRRRDRERHRDREKEGIPSMGWPGAPPFMPPMPGMPMMPPPWAVPPWGMPLMEHKGFPAYDAEEAERQLRKAEKAARKEEHRRQKHEEEKEKTQVWEDHPARVAQKKHSTSRSKSGSQGRERSRKDKAPKSKSSSAEISRAPAGKVKEDSGDSDVDISKVQEEINFADI